VKESEKNSFSNIIYTSERNKRNTINLVVVNNFFYLSDRKIERKYRLRGKVFLIDKIKYLE